MWEQARLCSCGDKQDFAAVESSSSKTLQLWGNTRLCSCVNKPDFAVVGKTQDFAVVGTSQTHSHTPTSHHTPPPRDVHTHPHPQAKNRTLLFQQHMYQKLNIAPAPYCQCGQHGLRTGNSSSEAAGTMPGGAAEDVPVCLVLRTASVTAMD